MHPVGRDSIIQFKTKTTQPHFHYRHTSTQGTWHPSFPGIGGESWEKYFSVSQTSDTRRGLSLLGTFKQMLLFFKSQKHFWKI